MAISVNWATKTINVPKADMTLIQASPTEIRELDLDVFRLALKALEAGEEGLPFEDTHSHNAAVTVGGVTLAQVIEIINGYTVTFEDGQYAVNLVGANSNVADVTNVNQVSVRSANSAGLIQVREIEATSFLGGVVIDIVEGIAGTTYPIGTFQSPVNNIDDALLIATIRGLPKLVLLSDLTISTQDVSNFEIIGAGGRNAQSLTIGAGAILLNTLIKSVSIGGTISDKCTIYDCVINTLTFAGEFLENSLLENEITLTGSGPVYILNCTDTDPGVATPSLNLASYTGQLSVRSYEGGLEIKNKTTADSIAIGFKGRGRLILNASVTNGMFRVGGHGTVVDNSSGTTLITDDLYNTTIVGDAVWDDLLSGHITIGTFGEAIQKTLGHHGENKVVEVISKDSNGNPNTQRVRIYNNSTNANINDGVTGLLIEMTVTANFSELTNPNPSSMDDFKSIS